MTPRILKTAAMAASFALAANVALADTLVIDLSHPVPTFQPMEGDPMKPDTSKPWLDSQPIPSFGQQTVLSIGQFPTNQGHFDLGLVVLSEHHGTHLDSPAHYVNNDETLVEGNPPADQRKYLHQLEASDLSGPIAFIDISGRVQAELDKNGGNPSPDTSVTDFSDDSGNAVIADDIAAVADKLVDGTWIVLHQGWSQFFWQGAEFGTAPYFNGFNFPGLTPAAVDKIIEIEDAKGIRINGIMSDVIGVETGQNSRGEDEAWSNSWNAHVNGMQRGWKIIENGANLGQLALAGPDNCSLLVGAPKWVRGTGGTSRVFAVCAN